jgi:hypothetical protein
MDDDLLIEFACNSVVLCVSFNSFHV